MTKILRDLKTACTVEAICKMALRLNPRVAL